MDLDFLPLYQSPLRLIVQRSAPHGDALTSKPSCLISALYEIISDLDFFFFLILGGGMGRRDLEDEPGIIPNIVISMIGCIILQNYGGPISQSPSQSYKGRILTFFCIFITVS